MIIDTHCHYNMDPLFSDWENHWAKAQEHGVTHSLVVGTAVETSQRAQLIVQKAAHLYAAPGIHPYRFTELAQTSQATPITDISAAITSQMKEIETLLKAPKTVAIGETGLDYFRLPDTAQRTHIIEAQQQGFIEHITLANTYHLPLIIHVRDQADQAYHDVLRLLKAHFTFKQPFILHCVSGPVDYVKEALELGAYLGMAGNSTYKSADHIRSLIKLAPLDRLVLETDAPFLPPQTYRGQQCDPWMIALTAEYVQSELGLDLEQIYRNTLRVFQLQ